MKKLKGIAERRAFEELEYEPFLDTREMGGFLLVQPARLPLPGEHFHCYALTLAIFELVPAGPMLATLDAWLLWSLKESWRFLGVAEQHTTNALNANRMLLRPYVETAVRFWPELKAVGRRYGPFVNAPEEAWTVMRNLKYSLANLGIAAAELRAEPRGGPADFLARINHQGLN